MVVVVAEEATAVVGRQHVDPPSAIIFAMVSNSELSIYPATSDSCSSPVRCSSTAAAVVVAAPDATPLAPVTWHLVPQAGVVNVMPKFAHDCCAVSDSAALGWHYPS